MFHVWRLPSSEQINPFEQACHALTLKDIFYAFGQAKVFNTSDFEI
jgi:hypothetical protein